MSGNKKYWVWLSLALGAAVRNDAILSSFPNPHVLFETPLSERIVEGVFTKQQLERLSKTKLEDAERVIASCEKYGWQIITPDDSVYPDGLRQICDMPLVLYVDGDISCVNSSVVIGVVGTRKPSYESISITRRISSDLSRAGAAVISGGALGIDSAAHEGAIEGGGKTICVLGCGFGTDYLMTNEPLRRSVSKNGALVTEYPPMTSASRYSFPERNRIISGMSHGLLVVEAGEKSGSLITARRAVEQGRDVFAIPGSILATAYMGVNSLIRDGAKAVTCAKDILEAYAVMYPEKLNLSSIGNVPNEPPINEKPKSAAKKDVSGLAPNEAAVYNVFGEDSLHPDEICAMSGLPLSAVIAALMQLQLMEYVEQDGGKNYKLTGR